MFIITIIIIIVKSKEQRKQCKKKKEEEEERESTNVNHAIVKKALEPIYFRIFFFRKNPVLKESKWKNGDINFIQGNLLQVVMVCQPSQHTVWKPNFLSDTPTGKLDSLTFWCHPFLPYIFPSVPPSFAPLSLQCQLFSGMLVQYKEKFVKTHRSNECWWNF